MNTGKIPRRTIVQKHPYLEELLEAALDIANREWNDNVGKAFSKAGVGSIAAEIYATWRAMELTEITPATMETTKLITGDVLSRAYGVWHGKILKWGRIVGPVEVDASVGIGSLTAELIRQHLQIALTPETA